MRILDLFCCEGGAGMGYHLAGFEVVGVDLSPQPRYPFEFIQANALSFPLDGFDVIHASPPCQFVSAVTPNDARGRHANLIPAIRGRLIEWGGPFVIENVAAKVLEAPMMLCGGSFGLPIKRHRFFESNVPLMGMACGCGIQTPRFPTQHGRRGTYLSSVVHLSGSAGGKGGVALRREAMEMPWATGYGCSQAIPPAYTELIGTQLLAHLEAQQAAA